MQLLPRPAPPLARLLARATGRPRRVIGQGNAARDARDWTAAAAAYAEALRLDPRSARILVQYGHALKEAGDLEGGEAAYRAALARRPADADTLLHLACLVGRRGDLAQAIGMLEDSLRLQPALAAARAELVRLERLDYAASITAAEAEFAGASAGAAVARLTRLLDLVPEDAGFLCELAVRLGPLGALDAAERAYRMALAANPACGLAAVALARRLLARGEEDAAVECLATLLWHAPLDEPARLELRGIKLRRNAALRQGVAIARGIAPEALPGSLDFVCFGTTGLCNASCIHCPTGKAETAHAPRVPMPMPLFERVVREMADMHYAVRGQISLGLFGDGLVDPHVVERVTLLRRLLPDAVISVNTNAAAYNPRKHAALLPLVSQISVHIESLRPEVYDRLMAPLRSERVFPKVEAILRDFPGKTYVSIPVSRLNRDDLPEMRRYFEDRDAFGIGFDGLSNRCAVDQTAFQALALNPKRISCRPDEVSDNLIIDCDGKVLICCNDFRRVEPIGDLATASLVETLLAPQRRLMLDQFAGGRHGERETCRRCYGDIRAAA